MQDLLVELFDESWASAAWDILGPAIPMLAAITVLAFAARITWAFGIISFAPIVIGAIGGYLAANLLVAGFGLVLSLLGAAVMGAWLGLVTAMLLGRLPAHAQSIATLAMAAAIAPLSRSLPGLSGGSDGITIAAIIPTGGNLPIFVNLALLGAVVVAGAALDNSWFAIAVRAVRRDQTLATSMGIQPRAIHAAGFALSGLLSGVAGAMLVLNSGVASPATFPISSGFLALAAVLVGGAYHWSGPLLGSLIFALPSAMLGQSTPAMLDLANAVAIIVLLIFLPRGLIDPRDNLRRDARERRHRRRVINLPPPTPDDSHRRRGSSRGLQSGHASRLTAAIKRRTGGAP